MSRRKRKRQTGPRTRSNQNQPPQNPPFHPVALGTIPFCLYSGICGWMFGRCSDFHRELQADCVAVRTRLCGGRKTSTV
jgi:hypothetical protein